MILINSGVTSTSFGTGRSISANSEVTKEYVALPTFCLMVDILGAGKYMCSPTNSIETFAKDTEFLFSTAFDGFNVAGNFENNPRLGKTKSMRISDTFVMWAHSCNSEKEKTSDPTLENDALEYLIMAGHHLMTRGFEKKFAFRGAITYGQCIQDISSNAIIGEPWVYANKLEKCQEWSGITIHSTAANKLTEEMKSGELITKYLVPFKGNQNRLEEWVVDWREWAKREDICNTFDSIPLSQNVGNNIKKNNTLSFFDKWTSPKRFQP
ncbi:MAG: hypothetical protein JNM24_17955 [Bdellovibrionaceae bacterium]|nr:hypothetical protein [Pseudobdellovibrionaceae bacterium]